MTNLVPAAIRHIHCRFVITIWESCNCVQMHQSSVCAEYSLLVRAPIEVYNALPMPLGVMLSSSNPYRSSLPSSVLVQPLQSCMLHQAGAFHELGAVQLEPMGYANSPAMGVPRGPPTGHGYVHLKAACRDDHAMIMRFKLQMANMLMLDNVCEPGNVHF